MPQHVRHRRCAAPTNSQPTHPLLLDKQTELRPTLDFMGAPVNPKQWRGRTVPPAFPIQASGGEASAEHAVLPACRPKPPSCISVRSLGDHSSPLLSCRWMSWTRLSPWPRASRSAPCSTTWPVRLRPRVRTDCDLACVSAACDTWSPARLVWPLPSPPRSHSVTEYKYGRRTSGWTLPAFSWFLDQTIGGAVATGTHGSSMRWGSLSSQLRGLRMVLANGTLLEVTPRSNPHLFMAAGGWEAVAALHTIVCVGICCTAMHLLDAPSLPPTLPPSTHQRLALQA